MKKNGPKVVTGLFEAAGLEDTIKTQMQEAAATVEAFAKLPIVADRIREYRRDIFAAHAMAALIIASKGNREVAAIADDAFTFADEMLGNAVLRAIER
jgi:hypothetical protein